MSFIDRTKNALALIKTKPGSEEEKAFYPVYFEIQEVEKPKFFFPRGEKDKEWFNTDYASEEYANAKSVLEKNNILYSMLVANCADAVYTTDLYFKIAAIFVSVYPELSLKELMTSDETPLPSFIAEFIDGGMIGDFIISGSDSTKALYRFLASTRKWITNTLTSMHEKDGSEFDPCCAESIAFNLKAGKDGDAIPNYPSLKFNSDPDGKKYELQTLLLMLLSWLDQIILE